jgi:hypothetical protein
MSVLESDFGSPVLPADEAAAFEAGYRAQAGKGFSFDIATFYNR